jgi:glycosyltransferase involved in cell wall biosynthesis
MSRNFKLLIGAGESKMQYIKKFSEYLEKFDVNCKLVLDVEICNGFPSKDIFQWMSPFKKFNSLIESFKPDAVFVDRQTQFGIAAIKARIPLLMQLRGNYWDEINWAKKNGTIKEKITLSIKEKIAENCFKGSKMILPFSNHLVEITKKKYPNKKIEVFHDGLEIKDWYKEEPMDFKHPCVGLLQNASIWKKSQEMFLLKNILDKFPNVTFYWAGDGIFRQKILEALGKYENFVWLGNLEYPNKVRKFLSSIDIYLLLSGYDTFGMTIIEAEVMQVPVIVTKVGGTSEAIIDGKTGFLVNQGDIKDIEDKINLLLNDKNLAKQIGNDGKKFVVENFSWENTVKKFIQNMKNSINTD